MKIKIIIRIALLMTTLLPSINGFERITSETDALSKKSKIIHLIGESHYDADDIAQKNILWELAQKRRIILGLEGYHKQELKEPNATTFGIEEEALHRSTLAFHGLVFFLQHSAYKKRMEITGSSDYENEYGTIFNQAHRVIQIILEAFREYSLTVIAIKEDPKEILFLKSQASKNQACMHLGQAVAENNDLDGYLDTIYKHFGKNSIDDNYFDNLSNNHSDWTTLLKRMTQYFVQNVSDKTMRNQLKSFLSQLKVLDRKIQNATNLSEIQKIEEHLENLDPEIKLTLSMVFRNNVFLQKIQQAYDEKKHLNKPFFVIVGKAHIPFLKQELMAQGFTVAVNDGVYDYSKLEL